MIFAIFFSLVIFPLQLYLVSCVSHCALYTHRNFNYGYHMAKRKWSWKHRLFISSRMPKGKFHLLLRFCSEKFGPDLGEFNNRWDYTGVKRVKNGYGYEYHNVQLFFRCQEDLVMFKLVYNPDEIYGKS